MAEFVAESGEGKGESSAKPPAAGLTQGPLPGRSEGVWHARGSSRVSWDRNGHLTALVFQWLVRGSASFVNLRV